MNRTVHCPFCKDTCLGNVCIHSLMLPGGTLSSEGRVPREGLEPRDPISCSSEELLTPVALIFFLFRMLF